MVIGRSVSNLITLSLALFLNGISELLYSGKGERNRETGREMERGTERQRNSDREIERLGDRDPGNRDKEREG